jgi:hypothetical protein
MEGSYAMEEQLCAVISKTFLHDARRKSAANVLFLLV